MCKLCNTSSKPFVPSKNATVKGSELEKYIMVVLNYTGENPCKKCRDLISSQISKCKSENKDPLEIDKYILSRLYLSYVRPLGGSSKQWHALYRKVTSYETHDIERKKAKLDSTKAKHKRIALGIYEVTKKTTTVYRVYVDVYNKSKRLCKTVNSLEEAYKLQDHFRHQESKARSTTSYLGINKTRYNTYVARLAKIESGLDEAIFVGTYKTIEEAQVALNKCRRKYNLREVYYEQTI